MAIYNIPKDDLLGIPLIVLVPKMFGFSKGSNNKRGWKHDKVYTKSDVSNKILRSLNKRINKQMILWG
jgi:hypothetical protein